MTHVKICGVTSVRDVELCVAAGADAIGLNFAPGSPRCLTLAAALPLAQAIPSHVLSVGVFVNAELAQLLEYKRALSLGCLQLHGDEPPELLSQVLPHAYKALRVRGADVLAEAARYAGEHLLLDAYVPGAHGGTGARFDWNLARDLGKVRKVTLAGGLTPDNVAEAIAVAQPFCVDVASGVESSPGQKDPERVRAFVRAAKKRLFT
ncbi:MAG TPA: phosphoribosylanthranilate isomerase [Polyangiales bacterium]|nr:phosphoribosylanthranilate isomerase [Polyangiales bacterium]